MVISAVKPVPSRSSVRVRLFQYLLCYTCIVTLLGSTTLPAKEESPSLKDAWDNASRLLINDSYDIFTNLKPSATADQRMIDFGRAATLINVQPKTSGNISEADELLQNVIKANPNDDLAISSQYILARIAQIHMTPPDDALAIERYTTLINAHPQHLLAQSAITKRAVIRFYALDTNSTLESRYQQMVKDAPLVTEPGSRRDYLLLLANASIRLNKPADVTLGHLLQAELCNNFRKRALGDLYVRIAEFSAVAGKKDMAISYYEKFLANFVRDNRRFIVKEKLAALKSGGVAQ
jgi:tetratricopeptide (TPR) repeat protein